MNLLTRNAVVGLLSVVIILMSIDFMLAKGLFELNIELGWKCYIFIEDWPA